MKHAKLTSVTTSFPKYPKSSIFRSRKPCPTTTVSPQYCKRVVYYFCLVPVPNVNEMVFARILTEFEDLVRFEKDGIYFLPYQGIKELLKKG